jgi:hypothetical protein
LRKEEQKKTSWAHRPFEHCRGSWRQWKIRVETSVADPVRFWTGYGF